MVLQLGTLGVTDPDTADEVFGESHKSQVVPVLSGTGLAGNVFVFQLCSGTGTVVDDVLEQLVHDVGGFCTDCRLGVAIVFID